MIKTEYICDRCEKENNDPDTWNWISLESRELNGYMYYYRRELWCNDCCNKVGFPVHPDLSISKIMEPA